MICIHSVYCPNRTEIVNGFCTLSNPTITIYLIINHPIYQAAHGLNMHIVLFPHLANTHMNISTLAHYVSCGCTECGMCNRNVL